MNRRELGFGIATTAVAVSANSAAYAQVRGRRAGTQAAPPSPEVVRSALMDQVSRLPQAVQGDVRAVYEASGWQPVWTNASLSGLNRAAFKAERHGLAANDYFDFVGYAADPSTGDVRTTAAALIYARVLAEGKVRPETVEELWEMGKNRVDLPGGLLIAISSNTMEPWVEGLAPDDIGYTNLSDGYLRYSKLVRDGGWPAFAAGPTIEPGASDRRVSAMIKRLVAEGDLSPQAAAQASADGVVYGYALQEAMRSFQVRHGLEGDGRVGPATQSSLGASALDRARQIALNLERRRWLKRELSPERIEVNTAASIMVYWKDGRPVHSNRVVVGSPENQTPSLEKDFASVVANPPWRVPAGIARREILPRGAAYMAARDMYLDNGMVVQRAGPQAALGYVKFELRDSYAIFLHDTPAKGAFTLSNRQRSHGCVRVQGAVEFARMLLSPDPDRLAEFDDAQISRDTQRIQTGREIGVRLLYWTAFVDGRGRVAFREDGYKRDAKLAQALGLAVSLPDAVKSAPEDPADVGP